MVRMSCMSWAGDILAYEEGSTQQNSLFSVKMIFCIYQTRTNYPNYIGILVIHVFGGQGIASLEDLGDICEIIH